MKTTITVLCNNQVILTHPVVATTLLGQDDIRNILNSAKTFNHACFLNDEKGSRDIKTYMDFYCYYWEDDFAANEENQFR